MSRIIATLSLAILPLFLYAQRIDQFSENPGEFITQIKEYMTASKQKQLEDVFSIFEKYWATGYFTEPEILQIIKTSNGMLAQRMTASPYFKEYLQCLNIVKNSSLGESRFRDWHAVLDNILMHIENRKLNPYLDFLEFSFPFFEKNLLRQSDIGVNWKADASRYEWRFEQNQPSIVYNEINLICLRKQDSIVIQKTKGAFFPTEGAWKGTGGKVTWERFGLDPNVYCELGSYEIDVKKSLYEVSPAKLHYPQFFGERMVEGKFEDKLTLGGDVTSGSYPRFESKERILQIDELGKGIRYIGGFRLNGTTVYGFGEKDQRAQISLYNDRNQRAYYGLAELFVIRRGEQISGEQVESTVYFGKDSLYHPSVNVRLKIPTRELSMSRGDRASDRNPFFSSMHQVNILADDIVCFLDADSVLIGKKTISVGAREKEVVFESLKFFRESDYRRIQNIASFNPIAIIKLVAEKEGNIIEAAYLAKRLDPKYGVENIQSLLFDLVSRGFINYDSDKQLVEVKDKIFHYAEASTQKVDYDVLQVNSKTEETNGTFDLKSKTISIDGVKNIEFSERQKVGLIPFNDQTVLRENRNMDFDGKLFAGFTTLLGTKFHFNYEKFQIELDSVRYFDIFVPTGQVDKKGKMLANAIHSRIEHLNGILLIDAPSNKSGKEDIPIFPSLNAKNNSFVFYDAKDIQGGVYNRDSFYFKLDPFSFNSLDKFGPKDLNFKGELRSADILPVFKEAIVLMPDTSLGFVTKTPATGHPAYLKKGKYTGEVSLSNLGLQGRGTLDYLGASIDSDDVIFKPKQLLCTAEKFDLEEVRNAPVEVPQVRGIKVNIDWRPYKDSMYVRSKEAPFDLFKAGEHKLAGTLILSPGGLKGRGTFDWQKATMDSELFNFGAFSVTSDTADVKIRAFNADAFALATNNLNANVNFDKQIGIFKGNDEFLETTLPYNQYKTSMNEFTWDMKEETITFATYEGKLGTFTSTHPDQDSLKFQGKTAFYNLKTNELKIGGVPYINSCDALIYTEKGAVDIQPGGVMTTLQNAKIVADTLNKYHVINRATVDILGKKQYKATGYYEYNIGDKKQEIYFAEIIGDRVGKGQRSEKATETRATGEVKPEDQFYIDLKTEFYGTIGLSSSKLNLRFDGFARLNVPNLPERDWFTISSEADKKDLVIQFDLPRNTAGEQVNTGLYLSKETALMYPRVMQPLYFRKDRQILPVKGVFKYDKLKDRFIFGDSLKVVASALKGNQLILNNRDASVELEGSFEIGSGLKNIKVTAMGKASSGFGNPSDTIATFKPIHLDMMAGVEFVIPERLLKIMINDIKSAAFDVTSINYLRDMDFYRKAAAELVPEKEKEFNEVLAGLNGGRFDLPKKYNKFTMLFTHLGMKWDVDYQSFVSKESKIGVHSIMGETIDKMLTAYVEFKMPTNEDDRLYIYLKSPGEFYYFFGYQQGIMNVVSNNPAFNDEVINMKKKEAIIKMENGELYEIAPVEPGTAEMFVRRVQAAQKN